jgi:hypothetical protein
MAREPAAPGALVMPVQAAPHMARQCGPPARPIKAALTNKDENIK